MVCRHNFIVPLLSVALLIATDSDAKKLHKWVDENGNVYYSDQVPPEKADKAREELNQQGVTVGNVDRAMSAEERAAYQAQKAAEEEARKQAEAEAQKDAVVLASYNSVDDIYRIRDGRIEALTRAIEGHQASLANLRKSLEAYNARAAESERQSREIPEIVSSAIAATRKQIAEQEEIIAEKMAERDGVEAEYEAEADRFREVLARQQAREAPKPTDGQ